MPLQYIEHFLVQTEDIGKTCEWYKRVLGFTDGRTPDFGFPVRWLYLGERDVVHVTQGGAQTSANRRRYLGQQSDALRGSGVLDHIAFRCTGLAATLAGLRAQEVQFSTRMVNDQGLYQVFLIDPNGIKIELNFANAEALEAGIRPERTASDPSG